MPYINQTRRNAFDFEIGMLIDKAQRIGELNYIITRILDGYINKFADKDGVDYSAINAVVGVLECAKAEFERRRLFPLEDKKRKKNGEVYV